VSKGRYKIVEKSNDIYELYEDGEFLVQFKRENLRQDLCKLHRSSHWVGCILRLFRREYPLPPPTDTRSDLERLIDRYREEGLADYLRSKGFKVVRPLRVSDREIITFLESQGYEIEGLLNDSYYSTAANYLKSSILDKSRP
jgi:hypothetical protein